MRALPLREGVPSARVLLPLIFSFLLVLAPASAFAADGGSSCADDAGNACDAGAVPPMPCDGGESGLCDTTNGASCSSAGERVELSWWVIAFAGLTLVHARRCNARALLRTERSQ